jgi:hypothetical protein
LHGTGGASGTLRNLRLARHWRSQWHPSDSPRLRVVAVCAGTLDVVGKGGFEGFDLLLNEFEKLLENSLVGTLSPEDEDGILDNAQRSAHGMGEIGQRRGQAVLFGEWIGYRVG